MMHSIYTPVCQHKVTVSNSCLSVTSIPKSLAYQGSLSKMPLHLSILKTTTQKCTTENVLSNVKWPLLRCMFMYSSFSAELWNGDSHTWCGVVRCDLTQHFLQVVWNETGQKWNYNPCVPSRMSLDRIWFLSHATSFLFTKRFLMFIA